MQTREHRRGAAASIAAATLWIVLASRSPTSTHHFSPLVIAGVWGYLTRHDRLPVPATADRVLMLGGGFFVAVAAQLVLTAADKLKGPPLIAAVPVPVELLIMAGLGAVIGAGGWQLLIGPKAATEQPSSTTRPRR
jgi:peptidoglycan/LPS O-acetylase OafA/YrhL